MEAGVRQNVISVLANTGFQVIELDIVKRISGIARPKLILVIADRVLMAFNSKGTKQLMTHSWITLSKLKIDGNKVSLSWEKSKFAFETKNTKLVITILDVVQRILLPSELTKINFDAIQTERVAATGRSFLARLREEARVARKLLPGKAINYIASAVTYSQPCLDFGKLSDCSSVIPYVIRALPLSDTIVDVTLRETHDFDVFGVLADLVKEKNHLKRLEIVGEKTSRYPSFMMNLKDNVNSELAGVSFVSSNFNAEHLSLLAETVIARKIKSVELHNAVSQDAMLHFYANFLNLPLLQNLVSLNLQGTKNLDIALLLPRIGTLEMLSLADCSLEVSAVMERLTRFCNLKVLDLSGNECARPVGTYSLPPCLHTLYVDNVTWVNQTLAKFINLVASRGMNLSIANIKLQSETAWQSLLATMESCEAGFLSGLNWSNNKISREFFAFLLANQELRLLNLTGCLRSANTDLINIACDYIKRQGSLKRLILRGTRSHYIGQGIAQVIHAVCVSMAEFDLVDLSNSQGGDFAIPLLRMFLDKPHKHVKRLVFDGICPTTAVNIMTFLQELSQHSDIKIGFPHHDLQSLRKDELLSIEALENVRSLFRESSTSTAFFAEPYKIYRHFHNDGFPVIPTEEVLQQQLRRPVAPALSISPKTSPSPGRRRVNSVSHRVHSRPTAAIFAREFTPAPGIKKAATVESDINDYNSFESPVSNQGGDDPVEDNSCSYNSDTAATSVSSDYAYESSSDSPEPVIPVACRRKQTPRRSIFARKSVTKSISSVSNINFESSSSPEMEKSIIAQECPEAVQPQRSASALQRRAEQAPEKPKPKQVKKKRPASALQRRNVEPEPVETKQPIVQKSSERRSASALGRRTRSASEAQLEPFEQHNEITRYEGHPGWGFPIVSGLCFEDDRTCTAVAQFSVNALIDTLLMEDEAHEMEIIERPIRRTVKRMVKRRN